MADESLQQRIINYMSAKPKKTVSLSRLCQAFKVAKKALNIQLYRLSKDGLVIKSNETPPEWTLKDGSYSLANCGISIPRCTKSPTNVYSDRKKIHEDTFRIIVDYLTNIKTAAKPLDLAKVAGYMRVSEINATLYHMQQKGWIVRSSEKPCLWSLGATHYCDDEDSDIAGDSNDDLCKRSKSAQEHSSAQNSTDAMSLIENYDSDNDAAVTEMDTDRNWETGDHLLNETMEFYNENDEKPRTHAGLLELDEAMLDENSMGSLELAHKETKNNESIEDIKDSKYGNLSENEGCSALEAKSFEYPALDIKNKFSTSHINNPVLEHNGKGNSNEHSDLGGMTDCIEVLKILQGYPGLANFVLIKKVPFDGTKLDEILRKCVSLNFVTGSSKLWKITTAGEKHLNSIGIGQEAGRYEGSGQPAKKPASVFTRPPPPSPRMILQVKDTYPTQVSVPVTVSSSNSVTSLSSSGKYNVTSCMPQQSTNHNVYSTAVGTSTRNSSVNLFAQSRQSSGNTQHQDQFSVSARPIRNITSSPVPLMSLSFDIPLTKNSDFTKIELESDVSMVPQSSPLPLLAAKSKAPPAWMGKPNVGLSEAQTNIYFGTVPSSREQTSFINTMSTNESLWGTDVTPLQSVYTSKKTTESAESNISPRQPQLDMFKKPTIEMSQVQRNINSASSREQTGLMNSMTACESLWGTDVKSLQSVSTSAKTTGSSESNFQSGQQNVGKILNVNVALNKAHASRNTSGSSMSSSVPAMIDIPAKYADYPNKCTTAQLLKQTTRPHRAGKPSGKQDLSKSAFAKSKPPSPLDLINGLQRAEISNKQSFPPKTADQQSHQFSSSAYQTASVVPSQTTSCQKSILRKSLYSQNQSGQNVPESISSHTKANSLLQTSMLTQSSSSQSETIKHNNFVSLPIGGPPAPPVVKLGLQQVAPLPSHVPSQPKCPGLSLSTESFNALNKNAVSALMEYAQIRKMVARVEVVSQKGSSHRPTFEMAAFVGDRKFPSVMCHNKKDGRKEACDIALRQLAAEGQLTACTAQSAAPLVPLSSMTHFDKVAALTHQTFTALVSQIMADSFAGRKVIAGLVMKRSEDDAGIVISLGSGNRCITGQQLSLQGNTVNDSHAEVITRRGFIRFLYKQLLEFNPTKAHPMFEVSPHGKLQVRPNISFHLYISTAPCGDGALFSPRDADSSKTPVDTRIRPPHEPTFSSNVQGLLRTKVEGGEGTIPIEPGFKSQTFDGIQRGERLLTMSCTDKICRWNVVGLQGALLSHFIEPVYLDSLTLGLLYDHGHLSRAVCCRLGQGQPYIDSLLPQGYYLNHPWLGRVTVCDPPREVQKTKALSINWCFGDNVLEVTDGALGLCCTSIEKGFFSRCSKRSLFNNYKTLCEKFNRHDLLNVNTYNEAKVSATDFVNAKVVMLKKFKDNGFGKWVSKPVEEEMFGWVEQT